MEEVRHLLNELLKNKCDRALTETIDLLKIAGEIYVRDFVELCSILDPNAYEESSYPAQAALQSRSKNRSLQEQKTICPYPPPGQGPE